MYPMVGLAFTIPRWGCLLSHGGGVYYPTVGVVKNCAALCLIGYSAKFVQVKNCTGQNLNSTKNEQVKNCTALYTLRYSAKIHQVKIYTS